MKVLEIKHNIIRLLNGEKMSIIGSAGGRFPAKMVKQKRAESIKLVLIKVKQEAK